MRYMASYTYVGTRMLHMGDCAMSIPDDDLRTADPVLPADTLRPSTTTPLTPPVPPPSSLPSSPSVPVQIPPVATNTLRQQPSLPPVPTTSSRLVTDTVATLPQPSADLLPTQPTAQSVVPQPPSQPTPQPVPIMTPKDTAATPNLHGLEPNVSSIRARKARHARFLTKQSYRILLAFSGILVVAGIGAYLAQWAHAPGLCIGLGLCCFVYAVWWRGDLHPLPAKKTDDITDRFSRSVLARLRPGTTLTPRLVWQAIGTHWQSTFISNRFLLGSSAIHDRLSNDPHDMQTVWQTARELADSNSSTTIEVGHVAGALLLTSPALANLLTEYKLQLADITAVVAWLTRGVALMKEDAPDFGGIGRDWAHGYTPTLDRFGYNISLGIERQGSHFGWLIKSAGVRAMHSSFSQGASAIALIGPSGVGKTSHVYALAQELLQEKKDQNLEHRQIISLSAATIIASATLPGELERVVTGIVNEAAHAGHVILFLDDAQLFFTNGVGSFNADRILLPVIQSRAVQMIMAFTPYDYQSLRTTSPSFAGLLTPVMLQEPDEVATMHVLEDSAINLEHRHHVLITYDALKEAYRLSGRYEQDVAYPGRAITLLEQALTHGDHGVITATSVQRALEQGRGVKVSSATSVESNTLLNLEDKIHERMINQTHAVSVVANALRRARAGVANPRRPIGSFLFLGPTGVGKTELAKAISAVYFGNEAKMVRLDMSEYQRPEDVSRLLSDGRNESASLIMSVRQQPFGVVLLDEVEKAHPNILNLLLQLLDEGALTDASGRAASFKDCVIIATSNAGANTIRERIGRGEPLESFEESLIDELLVSNQFKPELLNRFDEIVLFRPLNQPELLQVVQLMMDDINRTLAPQNIAVALTQAAAIKIVETGYDPRLGARPMRRALQRAVEDTVAQKILRGEAQPGSSLTLDEGDLSLPVKVNSEQTVIAS
jgi:ATP-dependent Clp protease ATP-binding subunit ClpC